MNVQFAPCLCPLSRSRFSCHIVILSYLLACGPALYLSFLSLSVSLLLMSTLISLLLFLCYTHTHDSLSRAISPLLASSLCSLLSICISYSFLFSLFFFQLDGSPSVLPFSSPYIVCPRVTRHNAETPLDGSVVQSDQSGSTNQRDSSVLECIREGAKHENNREENRNKTKPTTDEEERRRRKEGRHVMEVEEEAGHREHEREQKSEKESDKSVREEENGKMREREGRGDIRGERDGEQNQERRERERETEIERASMREREDKHSYETPLKLKERERKLVWNEDALSTSSSSLAAASPLSCDSTRSSRKSASPITITPAFASLPSSLSSSCALPSSSSSSSSFSTSATSTPSSSSSWSGSPGIARSPRRHVFQSFSSGKSIGSSAQSQLDNEEEERAWQREKQKQREIARSLMSQQQQLSSLSNNSPASSTPTIGATAAANQIDQPINLRHHHHKHRRIAQLQQQFEPVGSQQQSARAPAHAWQHPIGGDASGQSGGQLETKVCSGSADAEKREEGAVVGGEREREREEERTRGKSVLSSMLMTTMGNIQQPQQSLLSVPLTVPASPAARARQAQFLIGSPSLRPRRLPEDRAKSPHHSPTRTTPRRLEQFQFLANMAQQPVTGGVCVTASGSTTPSASARARGLLEMPLVNSPSLSSTRRSPVQSVWSSYSSPLLAKRRTLR